MSATFDLIDQCQMDKGRVVFGTFSFSGNYAAGGVDLSTVFKLGGVNSSYAPYAVLVYNSSSGAAAHYDFNWVRSTNKVKIIVGSTGVELADGAYPAAITDNPTEVVAYFHKI